MEKLFIDGKKLLCVKNLNKCYWVTVDGKIPTNKDGIDAKRSGKKIRNDKNENTTKILHNNEVIATVSNNGTYIVDNRLTKNKYIKSRFGIGKLINVTTNETIQLKVKDHFNFAGDIF